MHLHRHKLHTKYTVEYVLRKKDGFLFSYVFQAFVCGPLELVKIQQQVRPDCTSATETVKSIIEKSGFKGLSRGLGITVLREVPAFGLYFSSYEWMVNLKKDSAAWVFTAGGISGIISWIFTYPIDMVKTRLQGDVIGAGLRSFFLL